jgi:hypothetical protein
LKAALFLQPEQPQRSILNQSLRDRGARDAIGLRPLPKLEGESVSEFGLLRRRLASIERRPKTEGSTHGFIHPKFDEPQAVGFVHKEKG